MKVVRAQRNAFLLALVYLAAAANAVTHAQTGGSTPERKAPKAKVVPKSGAHAGAKKDTAAQSQGEKKAAASASGGTVTQAPKAKVVEPAKSTQAAKDSKAKTPETAPVAKGGQSSAKPAEKSGTKGAKKTPDKTAPKEKKEPEAKFIASPPKPREATPDSATPSAPAAADQAVQPTPPKTTPDFRPQIPAPSTAAGNVPSQPQVTPAAGDAASAAAVPRPDTAPMLPPLPAEGTPGAAPTDAPSQLFAPLPDPIGIPMPFGGMVPLPSTKRLERVPGPQVFRVGKFVVKYGTDIRKRNPRLPTEEELAKSPVELLQVGGVYYHVPQPQSTDRFKKAADPALPNSGPKAADAGSQSPADKTKSEKEKAEKAKAEKAEKEKLAKEKAAKPDPKAKKPKVVNLADPNPKIVEFRPSDSSTGRTISTEGLQDVYDNIVKQLNKRGLIGVYVLTNLNGRSPETEWTPGADVEVQVFVSEVKRARTIYRRVPFKAGDVSLINDDDAPDGIAVKDKKHLWIKDKSPVKPGGPIIRSVLQEYLTRLNRFPGRRVDAAMNASGESGKVIIDYLIKEQKPLFIYAQTSNTGTESTGVWRHRLGIEYKQLRNEDDILRLEYVTSDPSQYQSAYASYEFALDKPDYLKARLYANYGMYSAEDIGLSLENFEGENLTVGAALTWTPLYIKQFPLDITGGAEWLKVKVENPGFDSADASFILPFVSIGTDRRTDVFSLATHVEVQASFGGPDQADLDGLGRLETDGDFILGKADFAFSTYLEPIFYGSRWRDYARRDALTFDDRREYEKLGGKDTLGVDLAVYFDIKQKAEQKWKRGIRAHELALNARGQYAFSDARLSPQLEYIIGGFNSVRGYPEAFAAGDTGWFGSVEYRLHFPRLLAPYEVLDAQKDLKTLLASKPPQPKPKPKAIAKGKGKGEVRATEPTATPPPVLLTTADSQRPFNFRPPQAGMEPDWDLIFRVFADAGQTINNNIQPATEVDRSLLSVGAGIELQLFKPLYITFRLDYGYVLADETELLLEPVFAGDNRFHISGTIAW